MTIYRMTVDKMVDGIKNLSEIHRTPNLSLQGFSQNDFWQNDLSQNDFWLNDFSQNDC